MGKRLIIPELVREAIEKHVRERIAEAEQRSLSASEDEDTFTGHLGALLGAGERKVDVDGQQWYWSIDYTKFRGRGKDATEALIGADGIFEIRVRDTEIGGQKSVLFQSKMGKPQGMQAKTQAMFMSNWKEASVFLSYENEQVRVFALDDVLSGMPKRGETFADFFIDKYMACKVGDSDLFYDARARTLHWLDDKGDRVAVKFSIPQRLRVNIKSSFRPHSTTKFITPKELLQHRMDSQPEQRLGLDGDFTSADLKRAKNAAALLYHPDRSPNATEELRAVMNQRMAEANIAFATIKRKKHWKR